MHEVHVYLMFGIIAFIVVHVVEVICAGWPASRSMLSGYEIVSATAPGPIDGALPEPERLGTPTSSSAAHMTVDRQTRRGFAGVAASFAAGLALVAFGLLRGSGIERAARPRERGNVAAGEPPDDR